MTEFVFDEKAAKRATDFFEKYLTHVKGKWANQDGKPQRLKLDDWQRDKIIRPLFGWKRPDGTRRYRTCYVEIPRKNGKTTLAAGVGLKLLLADDEPGAEVYSAAADREQAAISFDIAKSMVSNEPTLAKRAKCFRRSISVRETGSYYKVLSADASTKHGFNPHGIIFDELHAQPNRELWDVLTTGTGSRRQPLIFAITTAGFDQESICWEIHEYACKVRDGIIDDPSFLPVIYGAGPDDDYLSEETWKRANPGYDVSIGRDYLEQEAKRAAESPAYQNTFKRLHLNIWTQQRTLWLDMDKWDKCNANVDAESLNARACYAGLDLASTKDITAFVLVFPPLHDADPYTILPFFWIPEDGARQRERRDRVPYSQWISDGLIQTTPGNVTDYAFVHKRILELAEQYSIQEIAFDPWNATQLATDLGQDGFRMIQFRQGTISMNEPSKEFERLMIAGKLAHGGNSVLRWMASNVSVKEDESANIRPVKPKEGGAKRVDGIVASIMALGRAMVTLDAGLQVMVI